MKLKATLLLGAFLLTFIPFINAQDSGAANDNFKSNSWSVSGTFGTTQFYGDVSRGVFFPGSKKDGEFGWTGILTATKYFTPAFGADIHLGYGKIASEYKGGTIYGSFDGNFIDYGIDGVVSFTNLFAPKKYNKRWNVYGLLGIANSHYNTTLYDQAGVEMNKLGSGFKPSDSDPDKRSKEAYYRLGTGIKYRLTNRLSLGAEAVINNLGADRFDGVVIEKTEYDKYGYTGLRLTYTFGKNNDLVPREFNPTPAEDLKMQKQLDDLAAKLKVVDDKVGVIDPKVTDLVDWKDKMNGPDDDGDGVPNFKDLEPNTPKGNFVNFQGVTVPMPEPTVDPGSLGGGLDDMLGWQSVYFALDKTYITSESNKRIANVAYIMNKYPDLKVDIIGSACKIAPNDYNNDLSKRRAEKVKSTLINKFNIDANRLDIKYVGEEKPISEILFLNRRVDFRAAK